MINNIILVGGNSSFILNDKKILSNLGYNVKHISYNHNYPAFCLKVKKEIKHTDLVFCWFASWESMPAVFFAKKYCIPSFVVVGGYDAANIPEINYGAFTNFKERIPAKYVLKNADLLLPVSKFTMNEILNKVKPNRIELIYNGVDTDLFKPHGKKESNIVITVGFLKRNNIYRKGIETFVKAAKYAPDLRFVVIGKPMDDSIVYLKSISTRNVEFTGFVSDKELIQWYQKATVICQLSYYEAFGMAPVEGIACGCIPVVTKERSGMQEFIGDIGFYVPYGDEIATAEAIKKAIELSDNYRIKVRKKIIEGFSILCREKKLNKLIKNINQIIG